MRTLLAIVFVLVAVVPLGFINLATYEALSEWGFRETVAEFTGTWINLACFIGCWIAGLDCLWVAACILHR